MSFIYGDFKFLIIGLVIVLAWAFIKYEKSSQNWITTYWFYKKSWTSKLSFFLFLMSISLFLFSLLDFRGPEKKIKAIVPEQKTIIMIDTSASMLVEDVRPNRYQKALLVARHFVRKAAGHQVALVLFSDNQKRILPFTDDLDLVDSRIASMESLNLNTGGSNIAQALQEAVQYFKANQGDTADIGGNVLLLTDSEENEEDFELNIPKSISVAVVGVGTTKGGPIPLRSRNGAFMGHKNYKGKKINSKMNETFLKKLQAKIESFNYWIVLSYSIPTEKILSFFKTQYDKKISQSDIRIRPVFAKYLIVPACVLLILSTMLSFFKSYRMVVFLFLFSSLGGEVFANSPSENTEKEEEEEVNPVKINALNLLRKHKLTKEQKLKLAESLIKNKAPKEGLTLYEENAKGNKLEKETLFNMGTAYILNKKFNEGIAVLGNLQRDLDPQKDGALVAATKNNILLALMSQQNEKKKRQQQKKQNKQQNKDQKDKQQGQQQQDKQDNQDNQDNQDQQGDQQGQQKKEDKQEKQQKPKKDKKEQEQEKDKGKDNDKKEKDKNEDKKDKKKKDQKKNKGEQRKEKKKLKSVIKQMLDFDRESQEQYMNTKYRKGSQQRGRKDW